VTRQPCARAPRRTRCEPLPALDAREWLAVLDAVNDPIFVHDAATGDILSIEDDD
jgi:hypothetical protein